MFTQNVCFAHMYMRATNGACSLERPICVMIVNVTVSLSFNLYKASLNEYELVFVFLKVKTEIYCCKKLILVFRIRGAAFVRPCVSAAMFFR